MAKDVRLGPGHLKIAANNAAIDILTSDPTLSVADAIALVRAFSEPLWDPITRRHVDGALVILALEAMKPKATSKRERGIFVYHATDAETAAILLRRGFLPETKPRPRSSSMDFAPGRGRDAGLYVGKTPESVSGYGRVILKIGVPVRFLEVPSEQASLSVTDPVLALETHDGAVIQSRIPPEAFSIHSSR
jgi:hypothetical protein